MRTRRALGSAILTLAFVSVAHASTVCDAWNDLRHFGLIGRTLFKAGVLSGYGCAAGSGYNKPVCTSRAKLAGFGLWDDGFGAPVNPLVATASTGAAVVVSHPEAKNPCSGTSIKGDLVTGTGACW